MDRRDARRAAARLRNLGKVVPIGRTDEERLRDAQQDLRSQEAYEVAQLCAGCQAAQRHSGDATALCDEHLRRALGM